MNNNDDPFWVGPRILRNLPLAIGPIFLCIPVIGILVGAPITILMILVEAAMLLITGKRIGDLLSGTSVIVIPDGNPLYSWQGDVSKLSSRFQTITKDPEDTLLLVNHGNGKTTYHKLRWRRIDE